MTARHRQWKLLRPIALALACGALAAAGEPTIVRVLDTRPHKGNCEPYGYVTGPRCVTARLYNDDLEISFWNQPSQMTFSLAKNDVWDRRYFGGRKRRITIDDVRRRCFAVPLPKDPKRYPGYGGLVGRNSDLGLPDAPHALYWAYDFPCPKPVGQVILRFPDFEADPQHTAGLTSGGELVVNASRTKAQSRLSAFLCKTRNLLVVRGACRGLTQPIRIELYRHKDTTPQGTSVAALANRGGKTGYDYTQDPDNGPLPPPEAGADGRFFWIRQRFPAEKTFPNGFECVTMAVLDGAECKVTAQNKVVGAGAPSVIHPISPEAYRRLPGWLKEVRIAAERVNRAEYGSLAAVSVPASDATFTLFVAVATTRDAANPLDAAKQMLRDALGAGAEGVAQRSTATTDAGLRAWRLSRVVHYNATSCTYADSTPWHGDYHFNESHFLPTIVLGQAATLGPRLRMFEQMLPALRRNAREVYRCRGICFPLVHYPIKTDRVTYTNVTWEWGIENTAFMLQPYWQTFQYTQDKGFLRTRAYPMMAEAARFYADYVTKGDDGRYHVVPTVSQEHWGFTPHFRLNRDSVGALSFVKYHLKACVRASEILGVDADERSRWRDIVEHLAPYPTLDTPEGPVFCDVRDAPRLLNYNITANLVMTLFAEDVSLDSPPELLELARRSYRAIPDREHSPRKGYLRRIRLFLGMLEKTWLSPQGRVLSWPGRIHIYAGVPKGAVVSDRFAGLLAVGGFKVSAMHVRKTVRRVRIESTVGGPCRVKSPWAPHGVRVVLWPARESVTHTKEGDTIAFDTQAGRTYALLSGPELALAAMRFVPDNKVVARWSFDRVADGLVPGEGGHAHAAKLLNGAALAPADAGNALMLPGPKSYAQVERTPAFDFAANESFSVEARVRVAPNAAAGMVPIVCSMASKQYCLTVSDGRAKFYLSSPDGPTYSFARGRTVVADGRWHRIRGVRDAAEGTVRIYVDGVLDGSAPDATDGDFAASAPITIGAYLWGEHTRFAQCLIDDVTIRRLGRLVPRE